jgi:purine-nucleoside/S-methyl-5'-thioadenosine phosphorylase / adenosine deaminase
MIEIIKSRLLTEKDFVDHGFTKRTGGVSKAPFDSLNLAFEIGDDDANVVQNLNLLKDELKIDAPLLRVKQIHKSRVALADELIGKAENLWTDPPTIEADAIIAQNGKAVIAVQTADCAPVLLADPTTRIVAAVHAGWRGTAAGILRKTVREMGSHGASQANIIAAIGPTICLDCYEVDAEVAGRFPESCDPVSGSPGKFMCDLPLAVEVSLLGVGLNGRNIDRLDICTAENRLEYFSYRDSRGTCGRGLGFIRA